MLNPDYRNRNPAAPRLAWRTPRAQTQPLKPVTVTVTLRHPRTGVGLCTAARASCMPKGKVLC